MKNKILLTLLAISLTFFGCKPEQRIEKIQDLTILHLTGSSYEQGLAHGKFLKVQIEETIIKWKNEVEETYQTDFHAVISDFFDKTGFVKEIEMICPDILEEVKGISDGCEIDFETMLAFQLSEEIDALSVDFQGNHCTTISINKSGDQPTILAQNMDPPKFLHGYPTLLHITDKDTRIESYILTFPGFIGLDGMNSHGVGIACNGISMLNHSDRGLPVSFIVRKILQMPGETEAFEFIEKVPIGIPQSFTMGGIREARCYECSANQKKRFYPFDNKNITLHTNFSGSNRDFSQQFIDLLKTYGKTIDDPYYCPRFYLAYDKILEAENMLNAETIQSILSHTEPEIHPISNENTYGCLVMVLSENPVLYIAPGKPDETEFEILTFH
ncbi:MAG: C45 family peptidase [Bacteroides sp.]|nr:C45 family peptidase [Bacteroides sp.]